MTAQGTHATRRIRMYDTRWDGRGNGMKGTHAKAHELKAQRPTQTSSQHQHEHDNIRKGSQLDIDSRRRHRLDQLQRASVCCVKGGDGISASRE